MEVIKSPLQPAYQDARGSYGNGICTQMGDSFSENFHPNRVKEVTPVKQNVMKSPAKSKTSCSCEDDLGKSPVRRKQDCDGVVRENGMLGKSPGKSVTHKETGASPHKHFCKSPRCAANNPDYAIPAPRQYLKSKRHLLPGWQPPTDSKSKAPVSPMRIGNASVIGSITNNQERVEEHNEGECISANSNYNVHCGVGGDAEHVSADIEVNISDMPDTQCEIQEVSRRGASLVGDHPFDKNGEQPVVDSKEMRLEVPPQHAVLSSTYEDSEINLNAVVEDAKLTKWGNNQTALPTESKCTRGRIEKVASSCTINVESMFRVVARRESRHTDSDFSMQSVGELEGDGGKNTKNKVCPPRVKGYHRMGGRRRSSGTASKESVSLKKQHAQKRKQAEDWMWDCAIKEAVCRLAPEGDRGVNVIVQAFESIKLTEEETQRSKYQNMAVALKGSHSQELCEADDDHVSQMETISSIDKVQAWDESKASSEFTDEMITYQLGQDVDNTPRNTQGRTFQNSSKSEPKVGSNRWATAIDLSMKSKDDMCSERGASSTSGQSETTEWTCERKSHAGYRRKQKVNRYTSSQPFRLRTEERGAMKEYEFSRRLQHLWAEEQRLRIPIAQGLPWTTDEPEVPPKPPIKDQTKPEGFKLFTDLRAVDRAEFDNHIAERNLQIELQRHEEERQRQIAEEEEIRRLRREMVPRAQLMPYFDRPFMPRRSSKRLTVPKEPNFHHKQSKRAKCMATCHL